jgi:hypothetical protein
MLAMRAEIASHPPIEFRPEERPAYDMLLEQTPPADGITYEAAEVGGVPGWWCRPEEGDSARPGLRISDGFHQISRLLF